MFVALLCLSLVAEANAVVVDSHGNIARATVIRRETNIVGATVIVDGQVVVNKEAKDVRSVLMRSDARMKIEEQQSKTEDRSEPIGNSQSLSPSTSLLQQSVRLHILASATQSPNVARVLMLTVANSNRSHGFAEKLSGITVTTVLGVDFRDYMTEEEEMEQTRISMSPKSQGEWRTNPEHDKNMIWENHTSNGALACALGHHKIWETVALVSDQREGTNRTWSLILEDDAWPNEHYQPIMPNISEFLGKVPPDVDIVLLDDRHCDPNGFRIGSNAYAITTKAAAALLSESFRFNADFWLDAPVKEGKVKMMCPDHHGDGLPFFFHDRSADSLIHIMSKQRQLISSAPHL